MCPYVRGTLGPPLIFCLLPTRPVSIVDDLRVTHAPPPSPSLSVPPTWSYHLCSLTPVPHESYVPPHLSSPLVLSEGPHSSVPPGLLSILNRPSPSPTRRVPLPCRSCFVVSAPLGQSLASRAVTRRADPRSLVPVLKTVLSEFPDSTWTFVSIFVIDQNSSSLYTSLKINF